MKSVESLRTGGSNSSRLYAGKIRFSRMNKTTLKDKFHMQVDDFPSRVVLELIPNCNLSCPMCPRQYVKMDETHMTPALFQKLVKEVLLKNKNAVILPFWRGESCLHPDFVNLMSFALDHGMRIHLSTNGHFMSRDFMDIFYRCEFITFSLHTSKGFANARKMISSKPAWSRTTLTIEFRVKTENANRPHGHGEMMQFIELKHRDYFRSEILKPLPSVPMRVRHQQAQKQKYYSK